jgi:hypothetical protein
MSTLVYLNWASIRSEIADRADQQPNLPLRGDE